MPEAWRIVKEKHAATAFDGKAPPRPVAAELAWRIPRLYSSTKSLATLESLVHLNPPDDL